VLKTPLVYMSSVHQGEIHTTILRVCRPSVQITIYSTKVIPHLSLGFLKIILDLNDACRPRSIVIQIPDLQRETAAESLRVDHGVNDGAAVAGYHAAEGVTAINVRGRGADGPEVDVVRAVVDEFDVFG